MPTPADDWVTTTQAAEIASQMRYVISGGRAAAITPQAICNWTARGHLQPAGLDHHGRRLYRRGDIAQAERATRGRALRLVGLPERQPTRPQDGQSPPRAGSSPVLL